MVQIRTLRPSNPCLPQSTGSPLQGAHIPLLPESSQRLTLVRVDNSGTKAVKTACTGLIGGKRLKTRIIATGMLAAAVVLSINACSSSSGPTFTCQVGWQDGSEATPQLFQTQQDAQAFSNQQDDAGPVFQGALVTITASQTVSIDDVTIVYYDSAGTEIGNHNAPVLYTLTPGQSRTVSDAGLGTYGAASCSVAQFSSGTGGN
jgi:hypothetical protein